MNEIINEISNELKIETWKVNNVIDLTNTDNTVHFIARYRKEKTGNLNENDIRDIIALNQKLISLKKAKDSAIKNIESQNKLTNELKELILAAKTLQEVEDIYAPYKRKKQTKADIAKKKGFDIIARQIKNQEQIKIPETLTKTYSKEEIIQGAIDIVAQEYVDNAKLKEFIRNQYKTSGVIESTFSKNINDKQSYKFKIYDGFSILISKLKSYQILALNRGESLDILKVKLKKNDIIFQRVLNTLISSKYNKEPLEESINSAYKKLFSSIENEIRKELTLKAQLKAIEMFQKNLKNLLLLKPHYNTSVLAIDPGFRTGCKICFIDKNNKPVEFTKIYLEQEKQAIEILDQIIKKHNPDKIVIGNGTASDETYNLIKSNFDINPIIVNESGASVYSTSKVGQEEFPNLDATDRGTISIGRRYIDCLSELVKIPVISIGVGMYQHDMNQKELEEKLTETIQDVVNLIGINVNTSSVHLLKNVSGLTKTTATKIFKNKPYKNREELKKILSDKTFEQSVGFLRIPESENKFDNTSIHPEQYQLAQKILFENIIPNNVSKETVEDIQAAYKNAGLELRQFEGNLSKSKTIKIEDLKINDMLNGIVRNVTQFGAFVDVGLKNDGLIHISQLANKFVKDPSEVVSIGQTLKCKVINIDLENKKVGLSLKDIN